MTVDARGACCPCLRISVGRRKERGGGVRGRWRERGEEVGGGGDGSCHGVSSGERCRSRSRTSAGRRRRRRRCRRRRRPRRESGPARSGRCWGRRRCRCRTRPRRRPAGRPPASPPPAGPRRARRPSAPAVCAGPHGRPGRVGLAGSVNVRSEPRRRRGPL